MGLLGLGGAGAGQSMHNTYKQNRNLTGKKNSLKDTSSRYNDALTGKKFEKREMSAEEKMLHDARMKSYKRSNQIRMVVLFVLMTAAIGGVIYIVS